MATLEGVIETSDAIAPVDRATVNAEALASPFRGVADALDDVGRAMLA